MAPKPPQPETTGESPRKRRRAAAPQQPVVKAVIFMGACAVSMMIAEERDGELRIIDTLSRPLALARDVFLNGNISRETMDSCVSIVQGYTGLLSEYRLAGEVPVRLVASNVLLDVHNMDSITNRLQITCGLHLEVLDGGEMTRLLYLSMQAVLTRHADLERKRVMVLHVGPGNTRLLFFDKGRINYYASYRIGVHRTHAAIGDEDVGSVQESSLIREHLRGFIDQLRHDAEEALSASPDALVIFGPDFHSIDSPLLESDSVSAETLQTLADEIAATPLRRRMERYREDYAGVGALLPAAITYLSLARTFAPQSILLPREDTEHGFLRYLLPARGDDQALEQEVIHFSILLANRYRVDKGHSQQVRRLSAALFDQLQELHGLSRHDRLLLKVAAILHEIGTYINPKRHHRHGQYIILNSEIFGLSRSDIEIVGLLARYHRHSALSMEASSYNELDQPTRLRVQKLAALLRVADAMESAHSRRISGFTVRYNQRRIELVVSGVHDLTIENIALRSKGDLFTDIFGYDIQLIPAQD